MKEQLIVLGFMAGLIFCATYTNKGLLEGFDGPRKTDASDCPNLLVKKGNKLMLLNNRKARIPGINPIFFDNLEDYTEFVKWQRSQNINCPVLYFNEMQDTQGNTNYRMLNAPSDPQAGLPSYGQATEVPDSMDHKPFNQTKYHGYDPNNQNSGIYNSMDKAFNTPGKTANAMEVNWAGAESSRRMVKSGKYDKDFRPTNKFSEFKGIVTKQAQNTGPTPSSRAPNARAPIRAGIITGEAEQDKIYKQMGRIK
jgi:hypothetical protein